MKGGKPGVVKNEYNTSSQGGKGGLGRIKVLEDFIDMKKVNIFGLKL